jgi:hypothetical protein
VTDSNRSPSVDFYVVKFQVQFAQRPMNCQLGFFSIVLIPSFLGSLLADLELEPSVIFSQISPLPFSQPIPFFFVFVTNSLKETASVANSATGMGTMDDPPLSLTSHVGGHEKKTLAHFTN